MKRLLEISVARMIWACFGMVLIGSNLTVLAWQVNEGAPVLIPVLGITGTLVGIVYLIFGEGGRRRSKPRG